MVVVIKVLEQSNPQKATGHGQIPPCFTKEGAEQLAVLIAYMFNESDCQWKFPSAHKATEA